MHCITMSNKFMFAQVHEIKLTDTTFVLVSVSNGIFFKNVFLIMDNNCFIPIVGWVESLQVESGQDSFAWHNFISVF